MKINPASQYCKKLRKLLPLSMPHRTQLLNDLRLRLTEWLEENPEADYQQLEAFFGTPEAVASAYLENTPSKELVNSISAKKAALFTVCAVLAISLVIWIGHLLHQTKRCLNAKGGYVTVEIVEGTEVYYP